MFRIRRAKASFCRAAPLCFVALIARPAAAGPLPLGFQSLPAASGAVIAGEIHGWDAATPMTRRLLDVLGPTFDGRRPALLLAVRDRYDRQVQALFQATLNGQPVRGLVIAMLGRKDALAGVLMERPGRLAASLPGQVEVFRQAMQRWDPATAPVELQTVTVGTETISLPSGWKILGVSGGTIDAVGPQGGVDLGLAAPVYTPEYVAQLGARPPGLFVAHYGDPARALQELFPQISDLLTRQGQPGWRWGRLLERSSLSWPQGIAQYLHYEWDLVGVGRMQSLALVYMAPTGPGTWLFYFSQVYAPADRFGLSLPTLAQIWSSWRTDPKVFQARLAQAARDMQEVTRLILEANAYRQETMRKVALAWDYLIRDLTPTVPSGSEGGIPILHPSDLPLPDGWSPVPLGQL